MGIKPDDPYRNDNIIKKISKLKNNEVNIILIDFFLPNYPFDSNPAENYFLEDLSLRVEKCPEKDWDRDPGSEPSLDKNLMNSLGIKPDDPKGIDILTAKVATATNKKLGEMNKKFIIPVLSQDTSPDLFLLAQHISFRLNQCPD